MSDSDRSVEKKTLPTPEDMLKILSEPGNPLDSAGRKYVKDFTEAAGIADEAYEHLVGLKDHYNHRKIWSFVIMTLMGSIVAFQCVLLGLVGAGVWDFSKYAWLLPVLLAQNFAQIVGLAVFVVKALFREMKR